MPTPENREQRKRSPADKVFDAAAAFLVTTVLVVSVSDTEHLTPAKGLVERCQREYPLFPAPVVRSAENEPEVALLDPAPDFGSVIKETLKEDTKAYLNSPARSDRMARRVGAFAAHMVEQANAGDSRYTFIPYDSTQPAPDRYQGFGMLYKNKDTRYIYGEGVAVPQASSDNIYRYKNGVYYAHPKPYHLSVSYHQAGAEFWSPEGLGLGHCATVPGNAQTQGWRVLYDEGGYVPMSIERWMGSTYDYIDWRSGEGLQGLRDIKKIENHAFEMLAVTER